MGNQTYNFAVMGAGRFAKHHIKILQEFKNVKLIGIASRTREGLDGVKGSVSKNVVLTTDTSKFINSKNVDCVLIATPPSTHFELAKAAIKAGKHVLLEKPMVTNLKEANELRKIVKSQNKVFMVAHQYIYNDYINYLKSNIKEIGKVSFVYGEHLYPGPMRDDIGCLWDAGTHVLSIIQYLFNPGNIKNISGNGTDILGNKLDDFTACTVEFENGLKALITVSWLYPEKSRRFIVFGNKSTVFFDDLSNDGKLKFCKVVPKNKQSRSIYSDNFEKMQITPIVKKISAENPLKNQLNHFLDCIRNGKEPETGIEKSYQVTEWLDRISADIKLPGYK